MKKVNFSVNKIKHCRKYLPKESKVQIVKGIIDPIFDYGSIIYHGFNIHGSANNEKRLQVAHNNCIRFVLNINRHAHISEYRNSLEFLTRFKRREYMIGSFIFNFLQNRSPSYLNDLFVFNDNNTRSKGSLVVKKIKLNRDKFLFKYSATNMWNNIPSDIKNSGSLKTFQEKFKNYLFNQQCAETKRS